MRRAGKAMRAALTLGLRILPPQAIAALAARVKRQIEDNVCFDLRFLALHLNAAQWLYLRAVWEGAVSFGPDYYLADLCLSFESGGEVDCIADDGVAASSLCTDQSDHRLARVDTDAEAWPPRVALDDSRRLPLEGEPSLRGPECVV